MIGCATAFQAPQVGGVLKSSSVVMKAEMSKSMPFLTVPPKLDGTMAGDVGFDPLRLSEISDVGLDLYWMREAELKHCRLAMLAVAGFWFQELVGSAPGFPSGKCQTDLLLDVWTQKPATIGGGFLGFMITELISWVATNKGRVSGERGPGEFGFDPMGFSKDPAAAKDLALKEVTNGRLAMFAAMGLIVQGFSTHKGGFENLFG